MRNIVLCRADTGILIHSGFAVVDWYLAICSPTRCSLRWFTDKERLLRQKISFTAQLSPKCRHNGCNRGDGDSVNSKRDGYICEVVLIKCYEHYYYYYYICILIVLRLFLLVFIPCTWLIVYIPSFTYVASFILISGDDLTYNIMYFCIATHLNKILFKPNIVLLHLLVYLVHVAFLR